MGEEQAREISVEEGEEDEWGKRGRMKNKETRIEEKAEVEEGKGGMR